MIKKGKSKKAESKIWIYHFWIYPFGGPRVYGTDDISRKITQHTLLFVAKKLSEKPQGASVRLKKTRYSIKCNLFINV